MRQPVHVDRPGMQRLHHGRNVPGGLHVGWDGVQHLHHGRHVSGVVPVVERMQQLRHERHVHRGSVNV
jgi:hypothetical protein